MKRKIIVLCLLEVIIFINFFSFKIDCKKMEVFVQSNNYLEGNFQIVSEQYIVEDKKIKAVAPKTEKSKFLNSFQTQNILLDLNCNNGTDYVGSGCIMNLHNQDLKSENYNIAVTGDVTGDGNHTLTDIVKIATYAEKKSGFSNEIYIDAADIDQNKTVTVDDTKTLAYYTIQNLEVPVRQYPTNASFEILSKTMILSRGSNSKIEVKTIQEGISIINWKSSDENVAVVDSTGTVTGINGGTATITATASNGDVVDATVSVVIVVPTTGIIIDKSQVTLVPGNVQRLIASVSPSDATNQDVMWTSSNAGVATVDANGNVKALSAGTTTITATTSDGLHYAVCTVEVQNVSVTISQTNMTIADESSFTLSATVSPTGIDSGVIWTSSDSNIATVDASGVVIGKNVGTAVITATSVANTNATATCAVTVREINVLMAGNSKTYKKDLPNEFKKIAENGGYAVNVVWFTDTGGKTLSTIYTMHTSEISTSYDYVIMQEQTATYSTDIDEFYSGVSTISQAVKQYNPNVQLFVRKTWVLNDSDDTTINTAYNNTSSVVSNLEMNTGYIAGIINDGPSMYYVLNNYQDINIFADERHQSSAGAYLTSSCIYATIFQKDPTLLTYHASLDNTAITLNSVAKEQCSNG